MHKRLKHGATEREQTIADVIRELLAREFPSSVAPYRRLTAIP
jgi:hypothetical protein